MKRFGILLAFIISCGKGLNYTQNFPFGKGYVLVDQDGNKVKLDEFKGKVLVVGYIYTHCPDVCPLITENMKKIYKKLEDKGLANKVVFLSITFDPRRDKPEVLKEYAKIYGIDRYKNWYLLTSDQKTIDSLMKDLSILVEIGPMEFTETGDTTYFIVHTDRIHIVDRKGKIVAYFKGSELKIDDAIKEIRRVL